LDRVVEEERHETNEHFGKTTEWLNRVIGAWRATISSGTTDTLQPNDVLLKLDEYSPTLLPDTRTYHMIVDANIMLNPSNAPDFCLSTLDRMN